MSDTTQDVFCRLPIPPEAPEYPDGIRAAEGAPEGEWASRIRAIWGAALALDPEVLDPRKPFFELGGFSLQAIQLVETINQSLGIDLPLDAILTHDTVEKLAAVSRTHAALRADDGSGARDERPPIPGPGSRAGGSGAFAMTDLQQAYWIGEKGIYQLDCPAIWYTEYLAPRLDECRFQSALDALIARHPMLRAVFTDEAQQLVLERVPSFPMAFEDLRGMDAEGRNARLAYWRDRMGSAIRPLTSWPLFDACVLRAEERDHVILSGRLIIMDGRSGEVFSEDLKQLYEDPDSPLPGLELDFAGYQEHVHGVLPERDPRFARDLAKGRAYWNERLASLPAAPALPRTARDPAAPARMRRLAFTLERGQWSKLKDVLKTRGITPTAAICLAFCRVLSAWSGSSHFTLNLMYGGRRPLHAQVNAIIGNFSDTLLLEYRETGTSLGEDAKALQARMFQDMQHGMVSGVSLIRELTRRKGTSDGAPLMPVVFASGLGLDLGTENGAESGFFMEKMGWDPVSNFIQTPQVALDHQIAENHGALMVQWDARDALFPTGLCDAMFSAYESLIRSLAARGDAAWEGPVPAIDIHGQIGVRDRLNYADASAPEAVTLHAGFLRQAAARPAAIALAWEGGSLTYSETLRRAMWIARELEQRGLRPAEPVGILLPKGPDQICAALGILIAGGAYVPFSVDNPEERVSKLVAHCRIRHVLTADPWAGYSFRSPAVPIEVGAWPDRGAALPEINASAGRMDKDVDPAALAYVIFTSGSTGMPKGVAVTHQAAMNTILDINRKFAVGPDDRVLAISELNFDLSVYDIFGLLHAGGTVVLPRADLAKNPIHLLNLVSAQRVTLWNTVPAFMEMVVEYAAERAPGQLAGLRVILMSGDWIPVTLPSRIRKLNPEAEIIGLGGATEAAIWSNWYPIGEVPAHWPSIPYGYPLRNQSFHVLDARLRPCPEHVAGELYIGGDGLALGYYGDPGRTAEQFIIHPGTGRRLYRTGDWGRYWEDGTLEFLGRRDTQVKIRGHRIEMGEIEAALLRLPEVREAAVVAIGPNAQDLRLVGFYAVKSGAAADSLALPDRLGRLLPAYMIPAELRALPNLPLSANGKVDRKVLLDLTAKAPVRAAEKAAREAPRSLLERTIHALWSEILERDVLGIDEGFFEMGGHSISAVRMINRLERKLGHSLSLSLVHENPSIRSLAGKIEEKGQAPEQWTPLVNLKNTAGAPTVFCIHPVGGNVFCYWELARHWKDVGLVGIQAKGAAQGHAPHEVIEAMAAEYWRFIRQRKPHGPYTLLGWSMGGLIALELAHLAKAAGEECRVAMLDTWVARIPGSRESETDCLISFFHDLNGGHPDGLEAGLSEGTLAEKLAQGLEYLRRRNLLSVEMGLDVIETLFGVFQANSRAIMDYRPRGLETPILLLEAERKNTLRFQDLRPMAQDPVWRSMLPGLEVEPIRGDHFTIVQKDAMAGLLPRLHAFFALEGEAAP